MKLMATVTISVEFDVEEAYLDKNGKTSYQVLAEIIKDRLDPWTDTALADGLSMETEVSTEIRPPGVGRGEVWDFTDYGLAF